MKAIQEPGQFSFLNNPIIFTFQTDSDDPMLIEVRTLSPGHYLPVTVYPHNKEVTLDIADIIAPYMSADYYFPEPGSDEDLRTRSSASQYRVIAGDYKFTGYALPGGVSGRMLRYLNTQGITMFDYRLLNPFVQFLLTTRTNGSNIRMRRRELTTVYFVYPTSGPIIIRSNTGGSYQIWSTLGFLVGLNLLRILSAMPEPANINQITFYVQDKESFRITLIDTLSESYHLLRFRNSLGVFENLELTGRGTKKPELSENSYLKYDPVVNTLVKARKRETITETMEIASGYRSAADINFIYDLLSSDEVYLVVNGMNYPCIVTSDLTQQTRQITPESVVLRIEMIDSGSNFTPLDNTEISETIYLVANTEDKITTQNSNYITL